MCVSMAAACPLRSFLRKYFKCAYAEAKATGCELYVDLMSEVSVRDSGSVCVWCCVCMYVCVCECECECVSECM